jgi:hypothetical protein
MMIEPYIEGKPDQTEFPIRGREEIKLAWGGKLMFHSCIVGGVIDARFLPAILKGIMEKIDSNKIYVKDFAKVGLEDDLVIAAKFKDFENQQFCATATKIHLESKFLS